MGDLSRRGNGWGVWAAPGIAALAAACLAAGCREARSLRWPEGGGLPWRGELRMRGRVRPEVRALARRIAAGRVIDGPAVGIGGERTDERSAMESLRDQATDAELEVLIDHPSAAVECAAFWSLAEGGRVPLLPLLRPRLDRTAMVETRSGCLGGGYRVSDFFVDVARDHLSEEDRARLDEEVALGGHELAGRAEALARLHAREDLYDEIRRLALSGSEPAALVPLARFGREQDVEVILRALEDPRAWGGYGFVFSAMAEMQSPAFVEAIATHQRTPGHSATAWDELYRAAAAQDLEAAAPILWFPLRRMALGSARDRHCEALLGALSANDDPAVEPILLALWRERHVDPAVVHRLFRSRPRESLGVALALLREPWELRQVPPEGLRAMLDEVRRADEEAWVRRVSVGLEDSPPEHFPVYLEQASAHPRAPLAEPLLSRLHMTA